MPPQSEPPKKNHNRLDCIIEVIVVVLPATGRSEPPKKNHNRLDCITEVIVVVLPATGRRWCATRHHVSSELSKPTMWNATRRVSH